MAFNVSFITPRWSDFIDIVLLYYLFLSLNDFCSIKFIDEKSNYFSSDFNKHFPQQFCVIISMDPSPSPPEWKYPFCPVSTYI